MGDARHPSTLRDALLGATAVVFCDGGSVPAAAEAAPAEELERATAPLLAVLDALTGRPEVRLLFLSSGGTVYGEPERLPVDENQPLRPRTAYGTIKAVAEDHLRRYRDQHQVGATALRCANVYGPGQAPFRSQGVIATLLASAAIGREVVIFGDGTSVRDYLFVEDLAGVVGALLRLRALPPAINVGAGVGTSLRELLELVERTTQGPLRVRYEPERPTDLRRVVLDIRLLRSLVEFDPLPLAGGLQRTWDVDASAAAATRS
jgi:UDP-glucose 4-epimerase